MMLRYSLALRVPHSFGRLVVGPNSVWMSVECLYKLSVCLLKMFVNFSGYFVYQLDILASLCEILFYFVQNNYAQ